MYTKYTVSKVLSTVCSLYLNLCKLCKQMLFAERDSVTRFSTIFFASKIRPGPHMNIFEIFDRKVQKTGVRVVNDYMGHPIFSLDTEIFIFRGSGYRVRIRLFSCTVVSSSGSVVIKRKAAFLGVHFIAILLYKKC